MNSKFASNRVKGFAAEDVAVQFLIQEGYDLLARNYYTKFSEIDIILRQQNQLVFVEVKSMINNKDIDVYSLLTPRKINRLTKAMNHWINANTTKIVNLELDPKNLDYRLDYVGILIDGSQQYIHHQEWVGIW